MNDWSASERAEALHQLRRIADALETVAEHGIDHRFKDPGFHVLIVQSDEEPPLRVRVEPETAIMVEKYREGDGAVIDAEDPT